MKRTATTIKLYIDGKWTEAMTLDDFIKRHKDNTRIERVYITESVSRKEAIELLRDFIK